MKHKKDRLRLRLTHNIIAKLKPHVIKSNRCFRTRKRRLSEPKDSDPLPVYKTSISNRRAKFTPLVYRDKLGSFYIPLLDKPASGIGCRSPPFFSFRFAQKTGTEGNTVYKGKNPYKTRIEKDDDGNEHYYVSFKDGLGINHDIEITLELYLEFLSFEKQYKRESNIFDRYIEHLDLTEKQLNQRAFHPAKTVEEQVVDEITRGILDKAISELPETQRRRFILYYDFGLTYEKIAQMEGCSKMAIKYSVDIAVEKIKNKIKNFKF